MQMKTKLVFSLLAATLVGCLLLSLASYLKGKRVGAAVVQHADVKKELFQLDREKHEIQQSVHALDTNALRNRILELSERVHEQAATAK